MAFKASLCYLLVSLSVALYYNITFFGQALVPLPSPVALTGPFLYYLAGFNHSSPQAQVVLWMLSFLLAGGFWVLSLSLGAKILKVQVRVLPRIPLTSLLYLIPFPWLLWVHGQSPQGPSLAALRESILIRKGLYWQVLGVEFYLNLAFFILGLLVSLWQVFLLRKDLDQGLGKALGLLTLAGVLSVLMASTVASFIYSVFF